MNTYKKYTIEELLLDDYFISSTLHPTQDSKEYWDYLLQNGYVQTDDFERATLFVHAVQSPKEKMFRKEKELLWERIEIENKKILANKIRRLHRVSLLAAACITILLGVTITSYFYREKDKTSINPMALLEQKTIEPVGEDICLILSDSEKMNFKEKSADVRYNKKGEVKVNSQTLLKEEHVNSEEKENSQLKEEETTYNQLIVPKGRHSTLLLSDGTKLWVNAASHVVYPVVFDREKREIYVKGEVYLEVARNESVPFIVKTDRMEIEVLGTSFNVKSFDAIEENSDVVLVTGSVNVRTESGKNVELKPNQRFSYAKDGKSIIENVDVYDYICWKDGLMRFKSENLSNILRRLSDYYGKDICWGKEIEDLKCSGKLDLKEDMENVLDGLTKMLPVVYSKNGENYHFSINN